MNANQVLTALESNIASARHRKVDVVSLDNLQAVVAELRELHEGDGTDPQPDLRLEQFRTRSARWLDGERHRDAMQIESVRNANVAGDAALKTLILINGGAAVALLAFLGHLHPTTPEQSDLLPIAVAMACFVGGVFAGGVASGFKYLSQFAFSGEWYRTGNALNAFSILSGIGALALFARGGYVAFRYFVPLT